MSAERKGRVSAVLAMVFGILAVGLTSRNVLLPYLARRQADKALQAPLFRALERHEPDTYRIVRATMIQGIKDKRPMDEVAAATRPLIGQAAEKYLQTADDQALLDVVKATVDEIEQAARKDPAVGYGIMYPGAAPSYVIGEYVDQKTLESEVAATARLIETGAEHRASPQDDEHAAKVLRGIASELQKTYGDDVQLLDRGWRPDVDKKRVCEIRVAMYRAIFALPQKDAAQVLRFILSDRG